MKTIYVKKSKMGVDSEQTKGSVLSTPFRTARSICGSRHRLRLTSGPLSVPSQCHLSHRKTIPSAVLIVLRRISDVSQSLYLFMLGLR
jgi:hypothetical protein